MHMLNLSNQEQRGEKKKPPSAALMKPNWCVHVSGCKVESISLNVDAVNTHRERPEVGILTYSHKHSVPGRMLLTQTGLLTV